MKPTPPKVKLAGLIAALTAMTTPLAARAITLLPPCTEDGNCTIGDIIAVFTNFAELLLGIMGSVALGFFIYGGFRWILSGGRPEEVQKGKDILRNSVIGIAIILLSGTIVRITTQALTGGQSTIPVVGESCTSPDGAGIYISVPAGIVDGEPKPQEVLCVPKGSRSVTVDGQQVTDRCAGINTIFENRGRGRPFTCVNINTEGATGCVRGLCTDAPADFACCIVRTGQ